jgi:hypothetical protein
MDPGFVAKYGQKLRENSEKLNNSQCVVWTKSPNKLYGTMYCKVGAAWKTFYVHRLAYMLEHNVSQLPSGLDVSHLCHNPKCIFASHLSLEPHAINNNRQHCLSANYCTGHGEYPDCMLNI